MKTLKKAMIIFTLVSLVMVNFVGCKDNGETLEVDNNTELIVDKASEEVSELVDEADEEEPAPDLLVQTDLPSLCEAYEDYFKIGVAVPMAFMGDDDMKYVLNHHFNSFTSENSMKPEAMMNAGNKGEVSFLTADLYVAYAEQYDIPLRGHTLVWHSQTPNWFFREGFGDTGDLASKDEMLSRMEYHIQSIMERYYDSNLYAWDVVNEVIDPSEDDFWRKSLWYNIVGPEFVEKAFEYSRMYANPDVKLFYNDYNIVADEEKRMAIFNMLKPLAEKGLVDGVGLQAHINVDGPTPEQFEETIELFASIGLEVHITELDVSVYTVSNSVLSEDLDALLIRQAYLYRDLFEVFKDHSDVVTSVTIWGMFDGDSWLNGFPTTRVNHPLLFDRDYQAKLAFYALVDPDSLPIYTKTIGIEAGSMDMTNYIDNFEYKLPASAKNGGNTIADTYMTWDDDYLYLHSDVNDMEAEDTDGVLYQFDFNNSKSIEIEVDDRLIHVDRLGLVTYQGQALTASGMDNDFDVFETDDGTLKVHVGEVSNGYQITIALPITDQGLYQSSRIGFDYLVTDDANTYHFHDIYSGEMTLPSNFANVRLDQARKATAAIVGTPIIDGEIDDVWDQANSIIVDTYTQNTQGATAEIRTLYDEDFLYLLAEVTDDHLQATAAADYEQDSIEVFIDENIERSPSYGDEDVQYRVNFENYVSINGGPEESDFLSAVTITDTGYIVEMAIPYLEGDKIPGQAIGFDIQINDDQGSGGRDSMANWNDLSGGGWSSTEDYGSLIFD